MPDDFLADRKKALEEAYFAKEKERLLERLRSEKEQKAVRDELAKVSGIGDEALLEKLAAVGLRADTWAAISLVPLVEVAWANGRVEEKERRAVLACAAADGVASGSPAFQLLEGWLDRRPDGRLLESWGEYTVGVCSGLGEDERRTLKAEVLGRARTVAEAAGGLPVLGGKTSAEEAVVLQELEKAFDGPR